MDRQKLAFISLCVAFGISGGIAHAGPCTQNDAGSGPTVGANAQANATGAGTGTQQHPPTAAMNSATQNKATSSEDAQRQEQGQPTAAEESAETNAKSAKMGEEQGQPSAAQQEEADIATTKSAKMSQGC
ncbi:MAG: hypothetical protein JOZ30_04330 [Hyphomicrobiales bacterium]|nr:hypothetical protein [Hyphomicrobiales bacterium]